LNQQQGITIQMNSQNFRSQKGPSKNLGTWDDIADVPFSDRVNGNEDASLRSRKFGSTVPPAGNQQHKAADPGANKPAKPTFLQTVAAFVVIAIAGVALFALLKLVFSMLGPVVAVLCPGRTGVSRVQLETLILGSPEMCQRTRMTIKR
jgi:hypothetical protein